MLIIKGALYKSGDKVLRPHYTGDFLMVDANEYITKEELKDQYGKQFVYETLKANDTIEVDGVTYYRAEYGPYHTEDFELLSDLSNLEYYDEDRSF